MQNRVGLYSEARRRASSKLQAPSPHDARLQVRASAREAVAAANVLQSFPKDPNTGGDAEALSDDAISTDPTRRTIDYGDKALVNPNDKAVDNGEDDNGNEDINGVKDNEGEDDGNDGMTMVLIWMTCTMMTRRMTMRRRTALTMLTKTRTRTRTTTRTRTRTRTRMRTRTTRRRTRNVIHVVEKKVKLVCVVDEVMW